MGTITSLKQIVEDRLLEGYAIGICQRSADPAVYKCVQNLKDPALQQKARWVLAKEILVDESATAKRGEPVCDENFRSAVRLIFSVDPKLGNELVSRALGAAALIADAISGQVHFGELRRGVEFLED